MTGAILFAILMIGILILDGVLWLTDKQTITQWHIKVNKERPWGSLLPLVYGTLIGHLYF